MREHSLPRWNFKGYRREFQGTYLDVSTSEAECPKKLRLLRPGTERTWWIKFFGEARNPRPVSWKRGDETSCRGSHNQRRKNITQYLWERTSLSISGEELLDFCKTNEFALVNGRKIGDLFGKFTSHQYNGSSMVDCLLTEITCFEKVSFFEIGDYIPWLSDHCPIFSYITLRNINKHTESPITLHKRDKGYTWDDECEEQFKAILSNYRTKLENANQATKFN